MEHFQYFCIKSKLLGDSELVKQNPIYAQANFHVWHFSVPFFAVLKNVSLPHRSGLCSKPGMTEGLTLQTLMALTQWIYEITV